MVVRNFQKLTNEKLLLTENCNMELIYVSIKLSQTSVYTPSMNTDRIQSC